MALVKLRLLGGALLVVVAASMLLADPNPVADPRSGAHTGLSGLSEAIEEDRGAPVTLFSSQAALREPGHVGIVIVPGTPNPLTPGEVDALEAHLDRDAHLWLLEETPHTEPVLEPHGIRVVPDRVLQPDSAYGHLGSGFVEANVRVGNQSHQVLLSSPVLLDVNTTQADVIGRTEVASRDVDHSDSVDAGDPAGEHPVVARGQGDAANLLVIADAGIFTNAMLEADGFENQELLAALLEQAPRGQVVVDATRNDPPAWMAPVKHATEVLVRAGTSPVPIALSSLALSGLAVALVHRAPERDAWRRHEHVLGEDKPAPEEGSEHRLRTAFATVLAGATGEDVAAFAREPLDELATLARDELGVTVPLAPERRGEAFQALRSHVEPEATMEETHA